MPARGGSAAAPGRRARRRRGAAFTLIEVILALAIVAVSIPAFLRVVQAAAEAGRAVEFAGREQLAFEGAMNYIESFLGRLPTEVGFVHQKDGEGSRFIVQGVYCAPGEPMRVRTGWNTQLDVRRAQNGTNSFVAASLPQDLNAPGSAPPPQPLALLKELGEVGWRFYIKEAGAWVDVLPEGVRPALIELKITQSDGLALPRMVFWLRPRKSGLYDE